MENNIEIEEGGVSIGDIFRTIFSQKWLALIIAAAITVLGTLGLHFMGKRSQVYSVSFVLQLPNTSETTSTSTSYTYPDGASFYFTDLIAKNNLKEVGSREDFKGVDVNKIVKEGGISISRAVDKVTEDSQNGVYDLSYTIKVNSKYFADEDVARDFIEALINFPCDYIKAMYIDYDQGLTASKSLITYDGRLDALKEQAEFILTNYENLITAYGAGIVVKEGKTLGYYQGQLQSYINTKATLDNLKTKALKNHYVMSDEKGQPLEAAISQYKQDIERKQDEKEKIELALEQLYAGTKGQSTSVIIDTETVMEYALQVAQLDKEIDYFEKFIEEGCYVNADFDKEVNAAEAQVEAFTKEFAEISSIVYTNNANVNYLNSNVIEVEGGRGLIMSAGISLVAGIIIAAIVAYIVGWNKQKKAKGVQGEGVPAGIEAPLTATDDTTDKEEKN